MGLFDFLKPKPKLYTGGDGSSNNSAVVINAPNSLVGIPAEYAWIEKKYGKLDVDWTISMRSHGQAGDKVFETFQINLAKGGSETVVFEISSFYGRI